MKILAVTNMYPSESAPAQGTFVEQQIQGLRGHGLDVKVLFINRRSHGIRSYLRLPALLRAALSEFDADVVHVMYGGVMAGLATRSIKDRPTVVTFHGSDLLGENLSGTLRKLVGAYGVMSSKGAARRASGIVVVATALKKRLPADLDEAKVRVIPCGIDLARFRVSDPSTCRRELGWSQDRFHVLFNSNNGDPVKRQDLARSAVAALNDTGVPAEFHELYGLSNDAVPQWLNASHVLLLTSLHEGSPTIIKEALACDLPIVSVDVGDVRDRIDGIEGCYIAGATPKELAEALRLVFNHRGRIEGRSKVAELSVDRIASSLSQFYEDLVRRH